MTLRMGRVIGIKPSGIERYKDLHANPWPDTVEELKNRNIQNFSIFLRAPENLLFSYWEYTGSNFEEDFAKTKESPRTQAWWDLTAPLQQPLASRKADEWWSPMERVFFAE